MKLQVKIPKGWYRLPANAKIKPRDREEGVFQWLLVPASDYGWHAGKERIYIRRLSQKQPRKPKQPKFSKELAPDGWRVLKMGETIKEGDKRRTKGTDHALTKCYCTIGMKVNPHCSNDYFRHISK